MKSDWVGSIVRPTPTGGAGLCGMSQLGKHRSRRHEKVPQLPRLSNVIRTARLLSYVVMDTVVEPFVDCPVESVTVTITV
jgi:hypothetical protein